MTDEKERIEYYTSDLRGERVDACGARLSGATRSLISTLIEDGFFLLNNKVPKKSDKVKIGDKIEIRFQPEKMPDLTPKDIPFDIIIDKPDYALIDKPAGLTVHPAPGHYDDTLVNALLFAFNIADNDNGFRPGIVHRLDKDTSGVIVIAKNALTRTKLSKLFGERLVKKKYLAICHGKPKFTEKKVETLMGRDKRNRKRMAVTDDGKNAVSIFTVKEIFDNTFLAEVEILTGRTHQIRVHSAYIGHPIVGDILYGGKELHGFGRQALHSHIIEFADPNTNENVYATSQLPEDMVDLIGKLNNKA